MRVFLFLFIAIGLTLARSNGLSKIKVLAMDEVKITSMAETKITSTYLTPTGSLENLRLFKAICRTASSTGAYSRTTYTTAASAIFTTPASAPLELGISDGGRVENTLELRTTRFRGDWIFQLFYR